MLNTQILPYVVRIQDMDTPWPAQLWVDDGCVHQEGVAMFNVGDLGYLTAEYFAYDNTRVLLDEDPAPESDPKLVMAETGVVIPVWHIRSNPKARTRYFRVAMPALKTYKCDIQGWVGASGDTKMRAASMALVNLPDLHWLQVAETAPDEDHELFTMRGMTSRKAVLTLTTGDWKVDLTESRTAVAQDTPQVYHATLTRKDGAPFALGDHEVSDGIVDALYKFLSFQSGRWITLSTVTCFPLDPRDAVVERAWVGQVDPQSLPTSGWTASEWRNWPALFEAFWDQYTDAESGGHLKNAVHHYVNCQRIFDDGTVDYALVAAQSTLEALARWWTGKSVTYEFFRSGFYDELPTAILNAELGKDEAKTVDPDQQSAVLERARKYRNDIDHGQGGRMGEIVRDVVGCQMYYHGLARLLILARLGDRGCDARGNPYGPSFVETGQ